MARPAADTPKRSGTLETCRDAKGRVYFRGKVRLQDGSREPVAIPAQFLHSKVLAKEYLEEEQRMEDEEHGLYLAKLARMRKAEANVAGALGELSGAWFGRYVAVHAALGIGTAQHAGDWARYVAPVVGSKAMAAITPEDVRTIRDRLTALRLDRTLSAKRALNVWSTVVKAPFSRAWTDDDPKYSSVRVGPYAANPAIGIKPPVSRDDCAEDERERQALEPAEAAAVLAAAAIPVETRRFYAWSMFTGLRPAELYGLQWSDVRERVIKVQRGRDMKSGDDGRTKNRQSVRDVPIHPRLAPLVDAMRATGRVFPMANVRDVETHSAGLRAQLLEVGITRSELHEGTPTLRPFDMRSWRTCFATWCAASGFDSAWIDRWLGHAPKTTTAKHYVKGTGEMTEGVFPEIPPELLESQSGSQSGGGSDTSHRVLSRPADGAAMTDTDLESRTSTQSAAFKSLPSHKDSNELEGRRTDPRTPRTESTARAIALAAAVEAMSAGHARVLAGELRALLEESFGESAAVIPIGARGVRR